jgi:hypothetical protein
VRSARAFSGQRLTVRQSGADTTLDLPAGLKDPVDTIVVLDVADGR